MTPSLYTGQLLSSCGVPDLDRLLGGGLALGSALVIEEDRAGLYSK